MKQLTSDIPFVGTVIGLAEMAGKAAYDIFVVKAMAQRVIAFETMCGDAAWFSSRIALEIAELNKKQIKQIRNKHARLSRKQKQKKVCVMMSVFRVELTRKLFCCHILQTAFSFY